MGTEMELNVEFAVHDVLFSSRNESTILYRDQSINEKSLGGDANTVHCL